MSSDNAKPNKLIKELSPYLLQHAHNPVEWLPYGEEALELAVKHNKPILISIGYSTCHWCHVMERESFESEKIAEKLNRAFICIKVDREERPDLDHHYMNLAVKINGHGGWPLNIFLTPAMRPFLFATYIPPGNSGDRKGLAELTDEIFNIWTNSPERIHSSADSIQAHVKGLELDLKNREKPETDIFEKTEEVFRQFFDRKHGGFGDHTKFPCPHQYAYILKSSGKSPMRNWSIYLIYPFTE